MKFSKLPTIYRDEDGDTVFLTIPGCPLLAAVINSKRTNLVDPERPSRWFLDRDDKVARRFTQFRTDGFSRRVFSGTTFFLGVKVRRLV